MVAADGTPVRGRDRRSHAFLHQIAAAYEGGFYDDMIHVSAGLRMPFMQRDLNQLCFLQVTGTSGVGFPTCTSAAPSAVAANGTRDPARLDHQPVRAAGREDGEFQPRAAQCRHLGDAVRARAPILRRLCGRHRGAAYRQSLQWRQQRAMRDQRRLQPHRAGLSVYSSFSTVRPETSTNYNIGYR